MSLSMSMSIRIYKVGNNSNYYNSKFTKAYKTHKSGNLLWKRNVLVVNEKRVESEMTGRPMTEDG